MLFQVHKYGSKPLPSQPYVPLEPRDVQLHPQLRQQRGKPKSMQQCWRFGLLVEQCHRHMCAILPRQQSLELHHKRQLPLDYGDVRTDVYTRVLDTVNVQRTAGPMHLGRDYGDVHADLLFSEQLRRLHRGSEHLPVERRPVGVRSNLPKRLPNERVGLQQ